MAGLRVHFVFPAGLVERVDAALTVGQSRGEFVREAVEFKLRADGFPERFAEYCRRDAEQPECPDHGVAKEGRSSAGHREFPASAPLPASEQPDTRARAMARSASATYGEGTRTSVQAKRDVRPVPKAGEK